MPTGDCGINCDLCRLKRSIMQQLPGDGTWALVHMVFETLVKQDLGTLIDQPRSTTSRE